MSNYAIIDSNGAIVNMAVLDDKDNDWEPGDGLNSVKAEDDWAIGGVVIDGNYTPPTQDKPSNEELTYLNVQTKSALMGSCVEKISVLQYAVDLEMATDDEKTSLLSWRKYMVLLNRVDTNTPNNIEWPEQP